jgi:hypothetical protein
MTFDEIRTKLPYAMFTDKTGREFLLNRRYEVIAKRWLNEYDAHLVENTFHVNDIDCTNFFYNDSTSPTNNEFQFFNCELVMNTFMANEPVNKYFI